MFTVERESDHRKVVSLDYGSEHEDVEMYLQDDGTVYIRQFAEDLQEYALLIMGYQQLLDLLSSLETPEGIYEVCAVKGPV